MVERSHEQKIAMLKKLLGDKERNILFYWIVYVLFKGKRSAFQLGDTRRLGKHFKMKLQKISMKHVYVFLFSVKKTRVLIIAILTLNVTLWGHPIRGINRAFLS